MLLFLNIGTPELLVILFAVLLLFGGKKLPELARGLGQGIREFKDASDGVKQEIHRNINALNDDLKVDMNNQDLTADRTHEGLNVDTNYQNVTENTKPSETSQA